MTTNVDRPFCHRASGRVPDRNSSLLHHQTFPLFSCNKMDRSNLRAKEGQSWINLVTNQAGDNEGNDDRYRCFLGFRKKHLDDIVKRMTFIFFFFLNNSHLLSYFTVYIFFFETLWLETFCIEIKDIFGQFIPINGNKINIDNLGIDILNFKFLPPTFIFSFALSLDKSFNGQESIKWGNQSCRSSRGPRILAGVARNCEAGRISRCKQLGRFYLIREITFRVCTLGHRQYLNYKCNS